MRSRVVVFAASLLPALAACASHVAGSAGPAAPAAPAEPAWVRAPCTERLPDGTRLLVGVGELEPETKSPKLRDMLVGNRARAAVGAIGTAYIWAVLNSRRGGEPTRPPAQPELIEESIVTVEKVVFTAAKPEVTDLWVSPAGVAYARAVLRVDLVDAALVEWIARNSRGEPVFEGLFEEFEAKCRLVPPPKWR